MNRKLNEDKKKHANKTQPGLYASGMQDASGWVGHADGAGVSVPPPTKKRKPYYIPLPLELPSGVEKDDVISKIVLLYNSLCIRSAPTCLRRIRNMLIRGHNCKTLSHLLFFY